MLQTTRIDSQEPLPVDRRLRGRMGNPNDLRRRSPCPSGPSLRQKVPGPDADRRRSRCHSAHQGPSRRSSEPARVSHARPNTPPPSIDRWTGCSAMIALPPDLRRRGGVGHPADARVAARVRPSPRQRAGGARLGAFSPSGNAWIGVALTASALPLWFLQSLLLECRGRVERALASLAGTNDGIVPIAAWITWKGRKE
jgi:hypothetical protein